MGAAVVGIALAWAGIGLLRGVGANYFPRTQEIGARRPGAVAAGGPDRRQRPALRPRPGPARHRRAGGRVLALAGPIVNGQPGRPAPATGARGESVCRRHAAARRRGAAPGQPERAAAGGSGLRQPQPAERRRFSCRRHSIESPGASPSFWDELQRRVEALPGVSGVAFADGRPPNDVGNSQQLRSGGLPDAAGTVSAGHAVGRGDAGVLPACSASPSCKDVSSTSGTARRSISSRSSWIEPGRSGSFRTREPSASDSARAAARDCPWTTVVGVVSEVKYAGLDKPRSRARSTGRIGRVDPFRYLVLRTQRRSRDRAARGPASGPRARSESALFERRDDRRSGRAVAADAALAVAAGRRLCASSRSCSSIVGIYGVMAYYVQQHSKDISIRLALGGSPADVLRLVVGQGMRVVASGVVVGLLDRAGPHAVDVQPLVRRWRRRRVHVRRRQPPLADASRWWRCVVPARRAVAVQPAAVLRNE